MSFKKAEKKLKKMAKGEYYALQYELTVHPEYKHTEQACKVYISNVSWFSGKSWEIAFTLLEQAINPPKVNIENIEEIDLDNQSDL
jgi:hypothetical protein